MQPQKTAIIYARVSTKTQAEDGLPIESQLERCHRKADALGATVIREFVDAGISGRTDERPAFREAIAYCNAYSVDYFICWSTSRFSRNRIDAALYKRDLDKAETTLIYVSVDLDRSTDAGWMMESIFEIFDEHYSRQVSADTIRSMIKNARDGYWNGGTVPFGYAAQPEGKRKRLAINETEAAVIQTIFSHFLSGMGTKSIAEMLNDMGITFKGRRWKKNAIIDILKNDVYTGHIVFNRTSRTTKKPRPREEWIMTPSHPGIISQEDFDLTRQQFEERAPEINKGSPHSTFAFTGLLKCKHCGASMQIESATGRRRVYHYYNCRSAQNGEGCVSKRIPAEALDQWLTQVVMDQILTKESMVETINEIRAIAGDWVKQRAERRKIIVKTLDETETRLRNLYEVLELHGKNAPNLADLTIRMRDLKAQRDKLEGELVTLESEIDPYIEIGQDEVAAMAELMRDVVLNSGDNKKLREFFSTFIDRIEIDGGNITIHYNKDCVVNRAHIGAVHSRGIWCPEPGLLRTKRLVIAMPEIKHRMAA